MKIILLSSLVFLSLCTASKAQNFTLKPTPDIVGLQYSSVDFADIDGDGDLDLFTGGADPSYILTSRMYKNDGSGNLRYRTELLLSRSVKVLRLSET